MVALNLQLRMSFACVPCLALCLVFGASGFAQVAQQERRDPDSRREVSGTLQQTWSKRRQRHEYFVHSPSDGVRYYIATERDLSDYVGRRVTINGKPKLRSGQKVAEVAAGRVHIAADSPTVAPMSFRERLDQHLRRHQVEARPAKSGPPAASGPFAMRGPSGGGVRAVQYLEEVQVSPNDQIVIDGQVPGVMLDVPPLVQSSPYIDGGLPALNGVPVPAVAPLSGPVCETCGAHGGGRPCPFGTPHRIWFRGEFLAWATKGSFLPPLVTTSPIGTPQSDAGVLGEPGTTILYGDQRVLTNERNGLRLVMGTWLDCCQYWGVEGDIFGLEDKTTGFFASSGGDPILARPFFNAVTGQQDSDLVAYPQVTSGSVNVSLNSKFGGLGLRGRWNLAGTGSEQVRGCGPNTCYHGWRLDALGGYRFLRLREDLTIVENSQSLNPSVPVNFDIYDQFNTRNDFNGIDFGLLLEWQRCRWSLEVLGKIALGNSHQTVDINGSTTRTISGNVTTSPGGILAQTTNIGSYKRDRFAVVPEFGLSIGYDITSRFRASLGYTIIYWDKVARPGNQIDTTINPGLFPPPQNPLQGPLRPAFAFNESDFWAQGLDVGLRYIW